MQRPAGRYNPKDILRSMTESETSAKSPLFRQYGAFLLIKIRHPFGVSYRAGHEMKRKWEHYSVYSRG
jgi:hypothetical protein